MTGRLAVVRAQIAPDTYVGGLPEPRETAQAKADDLIAAIGRVGDTPGLVPFDIGAGMDCWIRARAVLSVDVVPTEDPGAGA